MIITIRRRQRNMRIYQNRLQLHAVHVEPLGLIEEVHLGNRLRHAPLLVAIFNAACLVCALYD